MWKFLSFCIVLVASTTSAHAQNCLSQSDAGNTKCITGVLYRCACSQIVGSTLCAWNNAATACSSVLDDRAASKTAEFDQKPKRAGVHQ